MAATSGSVLALAARLRALDDEALARLVTARGVREHGIRDFFDLAESLLDRASVQTALERLDRGTLALLATTGELASTSGAPTAAQLAERLGVDPGQQPQVLIPAGVWQSAAPAADEPVLVSCVVSPGFDFADFRLHTP